MPEKSDARLADVAARLSMSFSPKPTYNDFIDGHVLVRISEKDNIYGKQVSVNMLG